MNLGKPPVSVLILACLYIAVGTIGFAYHFPGPTAFHYEDMRIEPNCWHSSRECSCSRATIGHAGSR